MSTMDSFLRQQYDACRGALRAERCLSGEMPYAEWQAALRGALRDALCLPADCGDLALRHDGQERPGLDLFSYQAEPGLRTPMYRLLPEQVRPDTPVILCLHGHGYGCRDIVGLVEEDTYQKRFALRVGERGMIALAPEMAGFGTLRLEEEARCGDGKRSSCHRLAMNLLACGRSLLGVRVNQAMRLIDVAQALYPGHPLGMMGISGGGTVTALTMALDARPAACVVSGYGNLWRDSILAMRHCVDNYWPGMLRQMELPDLLAAIAPRPMLWETGSRDPIYPQASALEAASIVRAIYEQQGAPTAFEVDAFEGVHEISGRRAYAFLLEHCKNA